MSHKDTDCQGGSSLKERMRNENKTINRNKGLALYFSANGKLIPEPVSGLFTVKFYITYNCQHLYFDLLGNQYNNNESKQGLHYSRTLKPFLIE
jgi:hypothetical protein